MTDAIAERMDRAKSIAAEARINPQREKQLNTVLDREQSRERYMVTRPNEDPREVIFNPAQTIGDVRTLWYPGCGVLPA